MTERAYDKTFDSAYERAYDDDDLVFSLTFSPGIIPDNLVTTIAGTRDDYLTAEDEANEILTTFQENTPVITYKGLKPEDGNSLSDSSVSRIQEISERITSVGAILSVSFTATSNSADIVGAVQIFGPIYASLAGLILNDGSNTATCKTSWSDGDVVTAEAVFHKFSMMNIRRGA